MKLLERIRVTLVVTCLMTSSVLLTGCLNKQNVKSDIAFCPSSAFVNIPEYEIEGLKSKSDEEFHLKMAVLLVKYPQLLTAYADLNECWFHYHPKENK